MTREWIICYNTVSISQIIFAEELNFLSENYMLLKNVFVLIIILNVIMLFHTISDVEPFSVNFIRL